MMTIELGMICLVAMLLAYCCLRVRVCMPETISAAVPCVEINVLSQQAEVCAWCSPAARKGRAASPEPVCVYTPRKPLALR